MISKIEGTLESLNHASALISPGNGLTYEVLLSSYAAARLGGQVGRNVSLQTVHYLEGSSHGGNLIPRLAGFLTDSDRQFFQLFTSVKGIGAKKALKALALSSAQVSAAIADRDLKTLQSLPEIGRRMAETIVATLHGKVDRFLEADGAAGAGESPSPTAARTPARQALEILLQLGENRLAASQWVDAVLQKSPNLDDATQIVQEALRRKGG